MKIKIACFTMAATLSFASAGPTESNTGTIIVYRPWSIIGAHISNWRFNLNHGRDFVVRNGTYRRLTVMPGVSVISHDDMPFMDEDPQTVRVLPGQTVYFQYTAQMSLIFEVADDQERAARTVSKLEPIEEEPDLFPN
jgi:hypothetical protein